jgi:hypothetical protein
VATAEKDDFDATLCQVVHGLRPSDLIQLWDMQLVSWNEPRSASCLKYYLMLATLSKHAHPILERRDSNQLQRYMERHVFSDLSSMSSSVP